MHLYLSAEEMKPRAFIDGIPSGGVYVLVIRARGGERLIAGAWGTLGLVEGYYAYVGRAKRGLASRLARHFRRDKKCSRWHIDYLLENAEIEEAWVFPLQAGECDVARRLEESGARRTGMRGFGATDCRCPGHLLYFGGAKPSPPAGVVTIVNRDSSP